MAPESVFQGLRLFQVVEDVDLVGCSGSDRLRTALEVPAIVAGIDDVFFCANLPRLVTGEAAFADRQVVHDLRKVGLKGFTSRKGGQFDAALRIDEDKGIAFDFGDGKERKKK